MLNKSSNNRIAVPSNLVIAGLYRNEFTLGKKILECTQRIDMYSNLRQENRQVGCHMLVDGLGSFKIRDEKISWFCCSFRSQ